MKKNKIGPKMKLAVAYIKANPNCCIYPVAKYVGPHGSLKFGYEIVHRTIEAGLVAAKKGKDGRYILMAC